MNEQDFKRIEMQWKSDVDLKLDRLVRFADAYEAYLKLCMEREQQMKDLRRAVIEKTIIGLAWATIIFLGAAAWHYVRAMVK